MESKTSSSEPVFLNLNALNVYQINVYQIKVFKILVFWYILDFIFRITGVDIYILLIRLLKFKRLLVGSDILILILFVIFCTYSI